MLAFDLANVEVDVVGVQVVLAEDVLRVVKVVIVLRWYVDSSAVV